MKLTKAQKLIQDREAVESRYKDTFSEPVGGVLGDKILGKVSISGRLELPSHEYTHYLDSEQAVRYAKWILEMFEVD